MLDSTTAINIINDLQSNCNNINWTQFRHCNAYTTVDKQGGVTLECVIIGNVRYYVLPIMSYKTVVGFVHQANVYEVGKYSRTTSKQFTQICNAYFPHLDRVYIDIRYC